MGRRRRVSGLRFVLILLALAFSGALQPAQAVMSPQAKCRDAVAKSARTALNIVVKARASCLAQRMRRLLPSSVNCLADPVAFGGAGTGDSLTDEALTKLLARRDQSAASINTYCKGVDLMAAGVAGTCSPATNTAAALADCAVFGVGKPAGDALSRVIDVPPKASQPPVTARVCYQQVGLILSFSPRAFNRLREECLEVEEELGTDLHCRVTVAPPGIVTSTGSVEVDTLLEKRAHRWRGRLRKLCKDVDLSTINFAAAMGDLTGGTFDLTDLLERVYDAVLTGAAALDETMFVSDARCGDGVRGPGEECDDGDLASCDGCDRDCSVSACGNGAVCGSERCDDGNNSSGDGCSAACTIEAPGCGNGVREGTEQCDDGPNNSDSAPDACRTDCRSAHCGDSVTDSGEQCDPPDGVVCDSACKLLLCGNGMLDAGEQCDDGGETATCDPNCTFVSCGDGYRNASAGEACDTGGNSATCDSDCTPPLCGDGIFNAAAGEGCDDGDLVDGDGCDSNCKVTGCGNGIVTPPEACDDGNTTSGDGCSATCTCVGEPGCYTQDLDCPNRAELTLLAGTGGPCANNVDCLPGSTCDTVIDRCVTQSELDTGWTGIAHDSDTNDGVVVVADLVCPGPGPACGVCEVAGLAPDPGYCRCANNHRIICDQPFAPDADDCGGATCDCYFGPPLPLSSGNTPACAVNRFAVDLTGTANVDTGAGRVDARLASVVFLGIDLVTPCPVCGGTCTAPTSKLGAVCGQDADCDSEATCTTNADCTNPGGRCDNAHCYFDGACGNYDATANDGVRGGRCFGGDDDGDTCDVGAVNTAFPAPQGGGLSLDCRPAENLNVSGTGLRIALSQTTGTSSLLPAGVSCGFPPFTPLLCPCGRCSSDTTRPCNSNADCTGVGSCTNTAGTVQPNQCDGGVCTATGGGEGECSANVADKSCDGVTRPNGEGFIQCQSNADCSSANIGIVAGACTLTKKRECFPDPITATGIQDPETPLGVATFCIAATASSSINTVAGLPGPGRVKNQGVARTFCARDGTQYTPGFGGCP